MAEALGINPETKEKPVSYSDGLAAFGRMNVKFLGLVEKSFAEYVVLIFYGRAYSRFVFNSFVASERKTQVLPHMPMEKRKFVYEVSFVFLNLDIYYKYLLQLASAYRMDVQMVDQEPHRRYARNHSQPYKSSPILVFSVFNSSEG